MKREPVTDAEILRLYEAHGEVVLDFAGRIVRDRALAEDVLQETFLAARASWDRYDPSRPVRAWLLGLARNHALMAMRKRKKDERLATSAPARADETPSAVIRAAAATEERATAREALLDLDDETRALLVERHGLGRKIDEIAESWDVAEKTVRNRLKAAGEAFAKAFLARRAGGRS